MESGFTWEYETLINELTQGMEKAKLLQFHLCSTTSPSDTQHLLLQRILSSYEKSLSILNWRGPFGQLSVAAPPPTAGGGAPESSISVDGSPTSDEQNKNSGDRNNDASLKIVGPQSKYRDPMTTPLYSRSPTKGPTLAISS